MSIQVINLNCGSQIKMNMKVKYGKQLQLHRYHTLQRLCGKHEYYQSYGYLESMSKTLKSLP